jgi:myo-inositol-1(or 4)-monophosphatase
VAAAVVLVREAGGTLTSTDGGPYDPFAPNTLASNGPLHPVLLDHFRHGPRGL